MPDLVSTFLVSITGGLATGLTGLFGLSFTQRYTDNRKLIDSTLKELEDATNECAKVASRVWAAAGDPLSADVAETVCVLHEIAGMLRFVKERVPTAGMRVDSAHLNFRRATTGDDFDVKDRAPDLGRTSEIRSAATALKMACRSVVYDRNRIDIPFISD